MIKRWFFPQVWFLFIYFFNGGTSSVNVIKKKNFFCHKNTLHCSIVDWRSVQQHVPSFLFYSGNCKFCTLPTNTKRFFFKSYINIWTFQQCSLKRENKEWCRNLTSCRRRMLKGSARWQWGQGKMWSGSPPSLQWSVKVLSVREAAWRTSLNEFGLCCPGMSWFPTSFFDLAFWLAPKPDDGPCCSWF